MKDPFLDICSFFEDSKLNMLVKRALVTKVKNIIAREYENWLPKSRGNEIPIDKCKSNWRVFSLEKDLQDLQKIKGIWLSDIKGIWLSDNNDPLYVIIFLQSYINWEFFHLEIWQKWREHQIILIENFLTWKFDKSGENIKYLRSWFF